MNKQTIKENILTNSSPSLEKLPGKIVYWEKKKVYHKNQFHGNTYFKLQIVSEKEKRIVFVYPNLVSQQLFNDIGQYNHTGKEYIFFCEKRKKRGWNLHRWQELEFPNSQNQKKPSKKSCKI